MNLKKLTFHWNIIVEHSLLFRCVLTEFMSLSPCSVFIKIIEPSYFQTCSKFWVMDLDFFLLADTLVMSAQEVWFFGFVLLDVELVETPKYLCVNVCLFGSMHTSQLLKHVADLNHMLGCLFCQYQLQSVQVTAQSLVSCSARTSFSLCKWLRSLLCLVLIWITARSPVSEFGFASAWRDFAEPVHDDSCWTLVV